MDKTNDKLPEGIQEQIKSNAALISGYKEDEDSTPQRSGYYFGYIAGATAWAPWKVKYDELDKELALLRELNNEALKLTEKAQNRHQQLKERSEKMEHALIKIVGMSVGENCLRTVIIEIKNIASAAATFGCKQIEKEVNP